MNLRRALEANGWAALLPRAAGSAKRRFRDSLTSRKLHAPGFRIGRNPRLLGLKHMQVGRDFRAGDDLWLEAVAEFNGQTFDPELTIGDGVNVSDRVHIACIGNVSIGSGTLIGSRVIVSDHTHGIYQGDMQSSPEVPPNKRPLWSAGPVKIGRNVWLGDGVAVLAGATIGDGAIIGANSVVTGAIPPVHDRPRRSSQAGACVGRCDSGVGTDLQGIGERPCVRASSLRGKLTLMVCSTSGRRG